MFCCARIYLLAVLVGSALHMPEAFGDNGHQDSIIENYHRLSEEVIKSDLAMALSYADSALSLSEESENEKLILKSLHNLAVIYRQKGDYESAAKYNNQYFEADRDKAPNIERALVIYEKAAILNRQGNLVESIDAFLDAFEIAKEFGDQTLQFKIENGIAVTYKNLGQFEKAKDYFQKSSATCLALGDTASLVVIYNGLGLIYYDQDSIEEAEHYFEEGLKYAEQYENEMGRSFHLRNLGKIYIQREDYVRAEKLISESMQIRRKYQSEFVLAGSYHDLGLIYLKTDRYRLAIDNLEKSIKYLQEIGDKGSIPSVLIYLSEAYSKTGDYKKSNECLRESTRLHDSLYVEETSKEAYALEIKFQTAEKDKQLAEQNLLIERQKTQRNNLIFGLVALFIIAGLLISRYRQSLLLSGMKVENLEKQQKLLALDYMIQGQESERLRIAQDLHDGLGALLATARLQISKIRAELSNLQKISIFDDAENLINEAHKEVRRISHDMMPGALIDLGIGDAIEDLIGPIKQDGELNIIYNEKLQEPLKDNMKIQLYRIVQEIIQNTLKHAEATVLAIDLFSEGGHLKLQTKDDGIGFYQDDAVQGLGLNGIKSRVEYLNGDLEITSDSSKGTSFAIAFPM